MNNFYEEAARVLEENKRNSSWGQNLMSMQQFRQLSTSQQEQYIDNLFSIDPENPAIQRYISEQINPLNNLGRATNLGFAAVRGARNASTPSGGGGGRVGGPIDRFAAPIMEWNENQNKMQSIELARDANVPFPEVAGFAAELAVPGPQEAQVAAKATGGLLSEAAQMAGQGLTALGAAAVSIPRRLFGKFNPSGTILDDVMQDIEFTAPQLRDEAEEVALRLLETNMGPGSTALAVRHLAAEGSAANDLEDLLVNKGGYDSYFVRDMRSRIKNPDQEVEVTDAVAKFDMGLWRKYHMQHEAPQNRDGSIFQAFAGYTGMRANSMLPIQRVGTNRIDFEPDPYTQVFSGARPNSIPPYKPLSQTPISEAFLFDSVTNLGITKNTDNPAFNFVIHGYLKDRGPMQTMYPQDSQVIEDIISRMDEVYATSFGRIGSNTQLYRGTQLPMTSVPSDDPMDWIGSIIPTNGFISTSESLPLAAKFVFGEKGQRQPNSFPVIFRMEASAKTPGVNVVSISRFPGENEILLPRNTQFLVNDVIPRTTDFGVNYNIVDIKLLMDDVPVIGSNAQP